MTLRNAFADIATDVSVQELVTLAEGGVRAVRRDSDTTTVADGGAHPIYSNERGRVKVASAAEIFPVTTGNIAAIGDTVVADVGDASVITFYCTGTFAGVNCTFEGSIDGGVTWFGVQAVRTNANTVEATTGNLAAAPAYAWRISVNALARFRVRCTARTSGTQVWSILPGSFATEPIPAIQTHPVTVASGSVTATPLTPTAYSYVTTASTNSVVVKASGGNLYEATFSNVTASAMYVKIYNKATAPVVGTDVPVMTIPLPAGSFQSVQFGYTGKRLATGIGMAVTGAIAATDATATVAGAQIHISLA